MEFSVLFEKNEFKAFSLEHGVPILIISIIGFACIIYGLRTKNHYKQKVILFGLSLFPATSMVAC